MSKVSQMRSSRRLYMGVLGLGILAGTTSAQVLQEDVYRPFVETSIPVSLAGQVANGAASFRIDAAVVAELDQAGNVASIELPLGPGAVTRVELFRQTVLAEDARVVVVGEGGVERLVTPQVQIWSGTLGGDPDSSVFLGLSAGQAQGWVRTNGHTWLIATREVEGSPLTMAYEQGVLDQFGPTIMPACAGEVVPEGDVTPEATGLVDYSQRVTSCKALRLAVDTDNEFRNLFGSTAAATEYAVVLAAASSDIYNREIGSGWRLSYLRIWDTTDPWSATSTSAELTAFRAYWRANMTTITRASAHLLSGRSLGGGIAYLRAACSTQNGYGVSANLAGSFPFPIADNDSRNWDLMVFSHELGHQFGSEHTHNSCAYSPVVDGCGLSPSNSACEQGTQDCSVASARDATIMSYCHQCSGGMANMKMTFGPRVSSRMVAYVNGLSCPTTLTGPELVSVTQSPEGRLCPNTSVTFTAQATGTELRYQWFRNGARLTTATSPTLTVTSQADGNRFDVMVYSSCGTVTTFGTAMGKVLSVEGGVPVITEQPVSSGACPA
ncbi:MAG: zinc-dependent metalloprotease, partial [Planctomycetota bacterium]|nr:zinc-dependent metalloprotease [Planctomycetota bacterium]